MKIGFGAPVSGAWASAANLARFAEQAEELGYDSLWTFQRLLVGTDQDLAPVYQSVLDPLIALSFAAARTSRIRLGVAVLNLPFVSPAYLAKQAATLDLLSGGRLDLGLGSGWSAAEFTATGSSGARRVTRTVEYLKVLRTLWAAEVSEFTGELYTVPASRMLPKPVQRPGPPILLGGMVPAALARAGRLADGWLSSSGTDLTRISAQIATVRAAAEEAGKDPAALRIICRGVVRFGEVEAVGAGADGERARLSGSAERIREDVAWLGEQGVTELFYDLNWDPLIGNPLADRTAATERAEEILRALAPGNG
ncbi:MAG TPA: TIGR03619 family F420-dependent LLM class oxidoreductase [Pseudonocardiaceae bacterium]|jgi:probable F420-dependent oxidoreductase|nr:TIGR03619 family F420-dependent LLM class oxidoreductase [Pseudonocardiaceae bacterium]